MDEDHPQVVCRPGLVGFNMFCILFGYLVGGLEHFLFFQLTFIFFKGFGSTTNQICSEFLSILFSRHLRGRFDQPESAATGGLRPTAAVPKMSCVSPIPMQLLDILPREGGGSC